MTSRYFYIKTSKDFYIKNTFILKHMKI